MSDDRMPLWVLGRGKLVANATVTDEDTVTVRLDDDRNPEFWAELRLTSWDLAVLTQALAQVLTGRLCSDGICTCEAGGCCCPSDPGVV